MVVNVYVEGGVINGNVDASTNQILLRSLISRYQSLIMVLALTIPDLESSASCLM